VNSTVSSEVNPAACTLTGTDSGTFRAGTLNVNRSNPSVPGTGVAANDCAPSSTSRAPPKPRPVTVTAVS